MHLRKVEISQVRSLASFTWALGRHEPTAGWHVLLGDNGAGTSTVLQACALALLGPTQAPGLRQPWGSWVRHGATQARVALSVVPDEHGAWPDPARPVTPRDALDAGVCLSATGLEALPARSAPERHLWSGGAGWFSTAFVATGSRSGAGQALTPVSSAMPALARLLPLFGEDVALAGTLDWMRGLHHAECGVATAAPASALSPFITRLDQFIRQPGLLPDGVRLHGIGPRAVLCTDQAGVPVDILALGDGLRCVLGMVLGLVGQLAQAFGPDRVFSPDGTTVDLPGVVLLDRIDAHLHPRWQRLLGPWLTRHFPRMQFIVATHSPLVCQGAAHGSVTCLPGGRITGTVLDRLLYGDAQDALHSGAFGQGIGRSDVAMGMLEELAMLNVKAHRAGLSLPETERQARLQAVFGHLRTAHQ